MNDFIIYEKEGDIGKVILNKPESNNALDYLTLQNLIEAFETSRENEDICVIYSAEGKHFTVGADLKYGFRLASNKDKLQSP